MTVAGSDIVATFDAPDPDLGEDLFDAFANHVLFETVRLARADAPEPAA